MKKIITLLLAVTILFGCSSTDSESSSNNIEYDIEMIVKIGDYERKYVDVYSYNDYALSEFSFDTPMIYDNGTEFKLTNGYLYGISSTGILTGSIGELRLKLGQNLSIGQIINFGPSSAEGTNGPFEFDFGGYDGYGYYFNNENSYGQVKITGNQNNKLSGEFSFNNISVYSSTGTNEYAIVSGKFKNMPIE
jgi:uncharacterized protein YxeA